MVFETRQRPDPDDQKLQAPDARMLADLAFEIERLERDFRALFSPLPSGKKLSLIAATGMILGVFFPWLSLQNAPTEIGLTCGGAVHFFLGIATLANIERRIEKTHDLFTTRRHALLDIVIGLMAVLSSTILLVYYASLRSDMHGAMDIRFGFYVVLICSTLVSLGGFLQFTRGKVV